MAGAAERLHVTAPAMSRSLGRIRRTARVRAVTAEQYAAAEHVSVSRRGNFSIALDDALAQLGLTRRVVATAPA